MQNIIEVKNLSKSYDDGTVALNGVTFSVRKGEFMAIMGPSGSGKSTLLHLLGLLDIPTKGSYHLDGHPISSYSDIDLARIRNHHLGFVFQSFNLLPRTSVLENVKLPLFYSTVPEIEWEMKAKKAVEDVGLGHRMFHEPAELSGGEKQRVAIARALVNDPDIIFADEPTGNLDSKSGKNVMAIIQHLNEEHGKTIILITHETSTAEHSERIIHLIDGEIDSDHKVRNRLKTTDQYVK
ncbi:MAG: ABC transporter ATP-binding protein [Candidatus Paceibacterota bacterium]|jgi:putative ABC transport system ATP-binding protein